MKLEDFRIEYAGTRSHNDPPMFLEDKTARTLRWARDFLQGELAHRDTAAGTACVLRDRDDDYRFARAWYVGVLQDGRYALVEYFGDHNSYTFDSMKELLTVAALSGAVCII